MSKPAYPTYLGEVSSEPPAYLRPGPAGMALEIIERYGGIDGAHHKTWVIDQVARVLLGTPVTWTLASWADGQEEYRFEVGTSPAYEEWVRQQKNGEDGPESYNYDEGIAP
jgi:hypothetical protein